MTHRDELIERIERDLERYEQNQMKPRKRRVWSKVKANGQGIALREPRRAATMTEVGHVQ